MNVYSLRTATVILAICFCWVSAQAQKTVGNPLFLHLHDQMVMTEKYANVNGSPFFSDEWMLAAVMLDNGVVAENVKVKLDLLANELYYIDDNGKEMISTQNIKSVVFKNGINDTTSVFITKYALGGNTSFIPNGWMQLLVKGNASLLKSYHKDLKETTGYSVGTPEKNIITEVRYFIWYNNLLTRVKNTSDIAELFNKSTQKLVKNSKNESDLKQLVTLFNNGAL